MNIGFSKWVTAMDTEPQIEMIPCLVLFFLAVAYCETVGITPKRYSVVFFLPRLNAGILSLCLSLVRRK